MRRHPQTVAEAGDRALPWAALLLALLLALSRLIPAL